MAFNLIAGVAGLKYGFPRVLVREGRVGDVLVGGDAVWGYEWVAGRGMPAGSKGNLRNMRNKCRKHAEQMRKTCGTFFEGLMG